MKFKPLACIFIEQTFPWNCEKEKYYFVLSLGAYHFYTNKIVIHRDSHDFIRLEVLIYALKKGKTKKKKKKEAPLNKKRYTKNLKLN